MNIQDLVEHPSWGAFAWANLVIERQGGVIRWSKYVKEGNVRKQSTAQHITSTVFLSHLVLMRLIPYLRDQVDMHLVLLAKAVHDVGETYHIRGIKEGYDVSYEHKSDVKDLKEYEHFSQEVLIHFPEERRELDRAFLLQYAMKNPACFPNEAQLVMSELRRNNETECLLFDAIERVGYVHYALEQYVSWGNEKILKEVLQNQIPHLDLIAEELPGFAQVFWTEDIREALG